jgi:lauroyl/myristoyl acyltransferase
VKFGVTVLAAIFARAPRFALVLADLVARLTLRAGRRRAPHELDAHALRRFWTNHVRQLVLGVSVRRYGTRALHTLLLPSRELDALQPPCVLVTFHVGPIQAFSAVLERLGRTLVLREGRHSRELEIAETSGDRAALGIVRGVRWLREGGFVFLALDPHTASWVHAPFRGKTLRLARGAFALARITGVPLVPVVARWRGAHIELVFGDALTGSDEQVLASRVAQWLESYLGDHPGEISPRTLHLSS